MNKTKDQLFGEEIIPFFGAWNGPDETRPTPAELIGASIVGFGTVDADLDGGGLVIDFVPVGDSRTHRLIIEFTEAGMWVAAQGVKRPSPSSA